MKYILGLLLFVCFVACGSEKPSQEQLALPQANNDTSKTKAIKIPAKVYHIDYDTTEWLELIYLDSSFIIDMKYATTDNFVGEKMYECGRCFLRPSAARNLKKAHDEFKKQGLRLKLLDCYRPRPIQEKLWEKYPNPSYVTPPVRGSMHNRGKAVDLTFVDENGNDLEMGSPYDHFGEEAHHTYTQLPTEILDQRILLKESLKKYGFKGIRTEWWHYSYSDSPFGLSDWLWNCD